MPDGSPEKIASGVSRLALEYGVDSNSDDAVDAYKSADAVSSWDGVLTIRVSLIAASNQANVVDGDQTIAFPAGSGKEAKFSDGRLRHRFTTTIKLRNRGL